MKDNDHGTGLSAEDIAQAAAREKLAGDYMRLLLIVQAARDSLKEIYDEAKFYDYTEHTEEFHRTKELAQAGLAALDEALKGLK